MSKAHATQTGSTTKTTAIRTSTPGRLRSLLLDNLEPVLLLGAGASITSGIPAAAKTVEKVARWAWCKENGRHPDDFTIRRSDYWPWLTAQTWNKPVGGEERSTLIL